MIRVFTVKLAIAAALLASAAAGQDAPSAAPAAVTIPKDAVANADGTWSYTDKAGMHWTYRRTQIGISRVPARSAGEAALPAGLPKGATLNANGTFSWTDANGRKWVYARTPMGLSRSAAPTDSGWKITDKGDSLRFERPAPAGATVWEKKKTDLTDEERSAWEAQKAAALTARPE